MRRHNVLAPLLCLTFTACNALADGKSQPQLPAPAANAGAAFYSGKAEGWFWYHDPIEEENADPIKPEVAAAPAPVEKAPDEPLKGEPKKEEPTFLSVAWIKENLPKVRDRAIDTGDQKDIATYFYLQRVMMDKSQVFAERASEVVRKDPLLDEDTRRPTGTFAANAMTAEAGRQRDALLNRVVSEKAGLYYFFDSKCVLCGVQAKVVEMLANKTHMAVLPVSLDGKPMPNSDKYTEFKTDSGQASALGVTQTPAIALAVPTSGKVVIVSYGMVTMTVLEERVLLAAREAGLVTPQDYERTRPVQNNGMLAGNDLDGVDAKKAISDPDQFIQALRERLNGGE